MWWVSCHKKEHLVQASLPSTCYFLSFLAPPPPPPNLHLHLSGLSPGYSVMACQEMPLRGPRDGKISSDQTWSPHTHTHAPRHSGVLTSERWRGPVSVSHLIFIRPPRPDPESSRPAALAPCVCVCVSECVCCHVCVCVCASSDHIHGYCGSGPGCSGGQSVCVFVCDMMAFGTAGSPAQ